MKPLLSISHLNQSYGQQVLFQDFNLTLETGDIVGLFGPNGCGKSTLFRMMMGLTRNYDGSIRVDDRPPGLLANKSISYLPQTDILSAFATIDEALYFYQTFFPDFHHRRAKELIYRFGLRPESAVSRLSPGGRKKVAFTLAICRSVRLFLLDEPFTGLDPTAHSICLDILLRQFNQNSTLLIASNRISEIEGILNSVIFLEGGKILLHEHADRIRTEHKKSVSQFFQEVFPC